MPKNWIVGDVSGSQVLTDSDHLYPEHINELREDLTNAITFNVMDYGATADNVTDDSTAINAAITAASGVTYGTVYIPNGRYYIADTIVWKNIRGLVGESETGVFIRTDQNIPMLRIDVTASYYYREIKNITFLAGFAGDRTSNDGILITGTDNYYLAYWRFHNLKFVGTYIGIHSTKSTESGGENMFDWNRFFNLTFINSGSYLNQYGIKLDYGSGTGNIYSNMDINAVESCIEIGGTGDVNVGDIIFMGIQTSTAVNGIKLTKGATKYGSNVTVVGCQFDAGTDNSINFTNMNGFRVSQCVGVHNYVTTGCLNFHIDGGDIESRYRYSKYNITTGATTNIFKLILDAYKSVFVELITAGLIQGKGYGITTTTFHVGADGTPTATVTQLTDNKTGPGIITHASSVSGGEVIFTVAINSTSDNSYVTTSVRFVGDEYDQVAL